MIYCRVIFEVEVVNVDMLCPIVVDWAMRYIDGCFVVE